MAQNPKVPQEFWSSYIVEKLFKDNPHLNLCMDESKFVMGGSVVYIPQAGARPNVVKNRSSLPAATVQRADTAVLYLTLLHANSNYKYLIRNYLHEYLLHAKWRRINVWITTAPFFFNKETIPSSFV